MKFVESGTTAWEKCNILTLVSKWKRETVEVTIAWWLNTTELQNIALHLPVAFTWKFQKYVQQIDVEHMLHPFNPWLHSRIIVTQIFQLAGEYRHWFYTKSMDWGLVSFSLCNVICGPPNALLSLGSFDSVLLKMSFMLLKYWKPYYQKLQGVISRIFFLWYAWYVATNIVHRLHNIWDFL